MLTIALIQKPNGEIPSDGELERKKDKKKKKDKKSKSKKKITEEPEKYSPKKPPSVV